MALQINQVLIDHFASCRVRLVDFKLEFGVTEEGEIILADEISRILAVYGMKRAMKSLIKTYSVVILEI